MAIKSSSFSPKKIKQFFQVCAPILLVLTSCQTAPPIAAPPSHRGAEATPTYPTYPAPPATPTVDHEEQSPKTPPVPLGVSPRIGLILGPGALRSYAHVGVVQEFAKRKWPIQAIVGIEMGALVAAIYANKGQPYDVEWQMMKLKEDDVVQKGLLSSQVRSNDVKALHEFLSMALSSNRAENAKVAFGCPALQTEKQQVYMMNRGPFTDMLPFCLALPPLFKPHQQNIAGAVSLKPAVDFVRSKGATYVVYVDLLSGPARISGGTLETQVLWSLAAESLNYQEKGLDHVIRVPLKDIDLLDFNRRREVIQRGQKAAQEASVAIMKALNL